MVSCKLNNPAVIPEATPYEQAVHDRSLVVDGKSIFTMPEFYNPNVKTNLSFFLINPLDGIISKELLAAKPILTLKKNYFLDGEPDSFPLRLLYDDKKTGFDTHYKTFKQFNLVDYRKFSDPELNIDEDNDEKNLHDMNKANYIQINENALTQSSIVLSVFSLRYSDGSFRKYLLPAIATTTPNQTVLTTAPISHFDIANQELTYKGDVFLFLKGASAESDRRTDIYPDQELKVKLSGDDTDKKIEMSANWNISHSKFTTTKTAFINEDEDKFDRLNLSDFTFTKSVVDDAAEIKKLEYTGLSFSYSQAATGTTINEPYKANAASFIFAGNNNYPSEIAVLFSFTKDIESSSKNYGDFKITFSGRLTE